MWASKRRKRTKSGILIMRFWWITTQLTNRSGQRIGVSHRDSLHTLPCDSLVGDECHKLWENMGEGNVVCGISNTSNLCELEIRRARQGNGRGPRARSGDCTDYSQDWQESHSDRTADYWHRNLRSVRGSIPHLIRTSILPSIISHTLIYSNTVLHQAVDGLCENVWCQPISLLLFALSLLDPSTP